MHPQQGMNRLPMGRPDVVVSTKTLLPTWLALLGIAWLGMATLFAGSGLIRSSGIPVVVTLSIMIALPPLVFGFAYMFVKPFREIVLSWDTRFLFVVNGLRFGAFASLLLDARHVLPSTWAWTTTTVDLLLGLGSVAVAIGGYRSTYKIVSWGWAVVVSAGGLVAFGITQTWTIWLLSQEAHQQLAQSIVSVPFVIIPVVFLPLLAVVQLASLFKLIYVSSPPDRVTPTWDNILAPLEFPYALPYNLTPVSNWYIRTAYLALRPLKYLIMNNWFDVSRNYPRAGQVFPALFETGDKIARLIDDIATYGLAQAQPAFPDFTFAFDADKKSWEATWTEGPPTATRRFDIEETMFWVGFMHYKFGTQAAYLQFAADNLGQGVFNIFLGNLARHQINERVNPKSLGEAHPDGEEIRGLRGFRIFLFLHWLRRYYVWTGDKLCRPRWLLHVAWCRTLGQQTPLSWQAFHQRELNQTVHQADSMITLLVDPLVNVVYRMVQTAASGVQQARALALRQCWDNHFSTNLDSISDAFFDNLDRRFSAMVATLEEKGGEARLTQAKDLEAFRKALCWPQAEEPARREAQRALFRKHAEWLMDHVVAKGRDGRRQLQEWGAQLFDAGWPAFAWDPIREALDEVLLPLIKAGYGDLQDTFSPYPRSIHQDPTMPVKSFHPQIDPRLSDSWDQLFLVARAELMLGAKARSGYNPSADPPQVAWHRSFAKLRGSARLD